MDANDIKSTIEANEEKAIVERFNTAFFMEETITKVESKSSLVPKEGDGIDRLVCLLLFPTY